MKRLFIKTSIISSLLLMMSFSSLGRDIVDQDRVSVREVASVKSYDLKKTEVKKKKIKNKKETILQKK